MPDLQAKLKEIIHQLASESAPDPLPSGRMLAGRGYFFAAIRCAFESASALASLLQARRPEPHRPGPSRPSCVFA